MMEVLKKHRLDKHYSCEMMARKLGISKTYYWQIEQGKRRIPYALASKMAEVFDTTPDSLFYEDTYRLLCEKNKH